MSAPLPTRGPNHDLTRIVLAVLLIFTLISASFWILRPFLLSLVWATMIVVATWPLMLRAQAALRRRGLAVALMTGSMLLLFIGPLSFAIQALIDHGATIQHYVMVAVTQDIPPPPEWVTKIPLVGAKVAKEWGDVAAAGKEALAARFVPYSGGVAKWLASQAGSVGETVLQFLLTVLISAILYAQGETAAHAALRFGRRLAHDRGENVVRLAGQAIRGVALGVVVTALVQTLLAGLGLLVTGIPFAGALTAVILFLCIAQIGPLLVLGPAVVWLFWNDSTMLGAVLLVWSIAVGLLDNVLRPVLIRKGADLPMLLIFSGVIGGLLAFGIIGLFVGPVMLAVTYTLLREWLNDQPG